MVARLLTSSVAEYFADPCDVPSLSQSIAKTLLQKSPAHAYLEHPRLGKQPRLPTSAMDGGRLIHALLLGEGQSIEIINADNYRTKLAQEARDNAIASGALPVLAQKYAEALAAVARISANMASFGITLDGASEVAIEWEERGIDGPVLCRCRMDHVWLNEGRILDVKTAESAHPKAAARSFLNFGYHIQNAAYCRAMEALRPELAGHVRMSFVFVETDPPYAVLPAYASGQLQALGESAWRRAVCTWERCLARNDWPSYVLEPIMLEAPPWAMAEEIAEEEASV